MTKVADRLETTGSALIYAHHGVVIAVGAFGLIEHPSPAVASVVGGAVADTVWSVMFLVFGLLALGCRFANRHGMWWGGEHHRLDTVRSEALCIALIGFALLLFSSLIMYSALFIPHPPGAATGSIQTALALLGGSVFLPGVAALSLAMTRRERLYAAQQTAQVLDHLAREVGRTGEK